MKDIKIASNIKTVEQIKTELLKNIAGLYEDINLPGDSETPCRISDDAANIINLTYILCRRLGVGYDEVMNCMKEKLRRAIDDKHPIEKNFQDMSALYERLCENK